MTTEDRRQLYAARRISDLHTLFCASAASEADRAREKHKPMNSHHEAYAVILEELDEYWEEVRKKASERDPQAMLTELTQIAAMCVRTAVDLGLLEGNALS